MRRIDGRSLGLWSLRLDAAYCLVLGLFVALVAPWIATAVVLPADVLRVVGLAVVAWALLVLWMSARLPIRRALSIVMCANVPASVVVAGGALAAVNGIVAAAVVVVAVEIAAFAISQAVALRRLAAGSAASPTA